MLLADFEIDSEFGVSARWRADYNAGIIRLESRNLERLGNYTYLVSPDCVDQELMDQFVLKLRAARLQAAASPRARLATQESPT